MPVSKVAIVGAGTMGSSIAVAVAESGVRVVLKDVDEGLLQLGLTRIARIFEARVRKGLSAQDALRQRALIEASCDYRAFAAADLVIEAVAESLEIKKKVFAELDDCCNEHTIFASNTSCLSITQLGACTQRAHKVVGMHFFNPAHVMKLVEIVPGLDTSPETVRTAIGFGELLGKLAIRVDECPSFLVNRLLGRYMNEALWCLQEGTVSQEEIDQAATEFVMPIGPFALRDMNGADVGLAVASLNYQEYGERFRPAPLLEAMVKKNLLGQKTGEGFYLYDAASRKRKGVNPKVQEIVANIGVDRLLQAGDQTGSVFRVERLFLPMINEAFLVLQEKICDAQDLDPALMAGLGMRKGPLTLAAELGLAQCLSGLEVLFARYGERFRPASLLKRYVWAGHRSVL